jgi:hypothetical protein
MMKHFRFVRTTVLLALLAGVNLFSLTASAASPAKILLLLHGMNSSPTTWNSFVASQFSKQQQQRHSLGWRAAEYTADPQFERCLLLRVQFGFYDKTYGHTGLEGVTAKNSTLPTAGDFTDFNQLGTEVDNAISKRFATPMLSLFSPHGSEINLWTISTSS